jgi:hypothetical protein
MRTQTINIYSFDELSEEAKEKALNDYREGMTEIFGIDETVESLKGLFKNCNGITLKNWSLGDCQSWLNVTFENDEIGDFTGKRAMSWIENNLLVNIRIPENSFAMNGTRRKLAQYGQYYRAGMIKCCPFTGYCADDDFLQDLISEVKQGTDLKTAFEGLAVTCQKLIQNEQEYQQSEEYIKEHFEMNNCEFDEDGNLI